MHSSPHIGYNPRIRLSCLHYMFYESFKTPQFDYIPIECICMETFI